MNTVDVNDRIANVAQIVRKAPNITLRHAYVRAMRNWCQQSRWLRTNVPGVTEAGVQQYDLGNDPDLDIIAIFAMQATFTPANGNPQTWGLPASDSSNWNPNIANGGQPLRYAYVPEAEFALYPIPDQVYDLNVTVVLAPKEAAVNVPEAPLQKYSTVFEAGALAYLYEIPGMPWSNLQLAMVKAREFASGVNNAKAEVQRSYNTGALRANPRSLANFNNRGFATLGGFWGRP